MTLSDLTLEQLRNATLTQIRTAITNKLGNLTKKQLIILILKVADINVENMEIQDREEGEDGPNGQIFRNQIYRDVLGNKLKSIKTEWVYYPGQEGRRQIDTITITEKDGDDKVVLIKEIKHLLDGGQLKLIQKYP